MKEMEMNQDPDHLRGRVAMPIRRKIIISLNQCVQRSVKALDGGSSAVSYWSGILHNAQLRYGGGRRQ